MSLTIGSQLGPYEIISTLGVGGMGEVYRARDIRLGRDVALKILPASFSSDTSRQARFEQEARAVAALNHPNIVAVYDVGTRDSLSYMASELVEGESLRSLIEEGGMPARRVIDISAQLADGLAAAHAAGIVHRDLKPENVMLTRDGRVKILDFGLARQTVSTGPAEATRTILATGTTPGAILGTVAYMSPEQVRGQIADHRSDIFSFGTVLHEMISGAQPFRGDSSVEVMNAVLKEDPPELPAATSPSLRLIVLRCLEKDPNRRFQSASDLAFALRSASSGPVSSPSFAASPRKRSMLIPALAGFAAVVALAGTAAVFWPVAGQAPGRVVHFILPVPQSDQLVAGFVAVSRDGNSVAYVARRAGQTQIFIRSLDDPTPRVLTGTEEGSYPFFSNRGDHVIFLQQQKLKQIPVAGGAVAEIASNQVPRGFAALSDGRVVGISPDSSIKTFDPESRSVQTLFTPPKGSMLFEAAVPDGSEAIIYGRSTGPGSMSLYARPWNGEEVGPLVENAAFPRYASGYLLYRRDGSIAAVPFDPRELKVTGRAMRIPQLAGDNTASGFDVARDVLVYVTGEARLGSKQLISVERNGNFRNLAALPDDFVYLSLSPDGSRVALGGYGDAGDVWTYDLERGVVSRLTFEKEEEETPIWSPDGTRIAYAATRDRKRVIVYRSADGSGPEQVITATRGHSHLHSWSPDGKSIVFSMFATGGQSDIWVTPTDGSAEPRELIRSPFAKVDATFSPDGKWLAYTSDETGRREVYVTAYPGPGGKIQISNMGGQSPAWSRNGRELFYRDRNHIMVVQLQTGTQLKASVPRPIFDAPDYVGFAPTPDGRFVALPVDRETNPANLHVVLNWTAALKPAGSAENK